MSAIQTLPFALGEQAQPGTSNYDRIVGRTYLSPESGQGIYRLVVIGAALAGADLAGKALVGTGGTFEATAVAGANAAANTLLGVVHPGMTEAAVDGGFVLVLCEGQGVVDGDGGVDLVAGAAVGTDANGEADAAATTILGQVVADQSGINAQRFPNAVRIELDARLYVPGV
jgi:hypothetical protein